MEHDDEERTNASDVNEANVKVSCMVLALVDWSLSLSLLTVLTPPLSQLLKKSERGDADVKGDVEDESIQIRVKDQTGEEVFFKVKSHTQMGKIFDAYAKRRGVEPKVLRFMLDGRRILPTDTPTVLELEDRDQIDCLLEQIGGGVGSY